MLSKFKVSMCFALICILSLFQTQILLSNQVYASENELPIINKVYVENSTTPKFGETVKFIADAQGQNLQYEWHIYKDENEIHNQNYSADNYLEYTFKEVGIYKIEVKVKDELSNVSAKSCDNIEITDGDELSINSVAVDKKSPQPTGTTLKFTADAKGDGLSYQWSIYNDSKEIYNKPYEKENFLDYTANEGGLYKAVLTVKDENGKTISKSSDEIWVVYNVKINSVSSDKSGKHPVNTPINFTIWADGYDLTYGWYIYKDSEIVHQSLSTKNSTIQYIPNKPGVYKALVYAKDGFGRYVSKYSREIIIGSNDSLEKQKAEEFINGKNLSSKTNYLMWVDTDANLVYVFQGKKNEWVLLKTMSCTDGKSSTPTIKGNFSINGRGPWLTSYNGKVKAKYKVRIHEDYYFHSILFNTKGKIVDSRLGQSLSHGCVRLSVENAKWVYENIGDGTGVYIN